jgi:hypothetical protein
MLTRLVSITNSTDSAHTTRETVRLGSTVEAGDLTRRCVSRVTAHLRTDGRIAIVATLGQTRCNRAGATTSGHAVRRRDGSKAVERTDRRGTAVVASGRAAGSIAGVVAVALALGRVTDVVAVAGASRCVTLAVAQDSALGQGMLLWDRDGARCNTGRVSAKVVAFGLAVVGIAKVVAVRKARWRVATVVAVRSAKRGNHTVKTAIQHRHPRWGRPRTARAEWSGPAVAAVGLTVVYQRQVGHK